MLTKDYHRLNDVTKELGCTVDDLFHHALYGRINLGYVFHDELLYGVNADFQTVGAYSVSGVLSLPRALFQSWEFGDTDPVDAPGFRINSAFPPEITPASYLDELSFPPALAIWAPGRDWEHPETDYRQITMFCVGVLFQEDGTQPEFAFDGDPDHGFSVDYLKLDRHRIVIHTNELDRLRQMDDPTTPKRVHGGAERFSKQREECLGAALALLANHPDKCKSGNNITGAAIARALKMPEIASQFWPETKKPPIGEKLSDTINQWLNKLKGPTKY